MVLGDKIDIKMFTLNNMIYDYIGNLTTPFIWGKISTTTWVHVRDLTDVNLIL